VNWVGSVNETGASKGPWKIQESVHPMIRLDIWLTLASGEKLHAAELAFGNVDRQGRYASTFRYRASYQADSRARQICSNHNNYKPLHKFNLTPAEFLVIRR